MPDWLAALFRDGTVAYIAIGVLIVETAVLMIVRRRFGFSTGSLLFNAASGIALMLALRGALVDPQNYLWIALCMTAGLTAHVADMWTRARRNA